MGKQQRFSRRDFLKFGAVDSEAKVWVNGQYVGEHVGGYSAFEMDITPFVTSGENEIKVQATDDTNSDKPGESNPGPERSSDAGILRVPGSGRVSGWNMWERFI